MGLPFLSQTSPLLKVQSRLNPSSSLLSPSLTLHSHIPHPVHHGHRAAYPSKIIGRRRTVSPQTSNSGDSIWCDPGLSLPRPPLTPRRDSLPRPYPVLSGPSTYPHVVPRGWNTAAGGYPMVLSPMPGRHCALVLWLSPSAPSKEHTIPLVHDGQKYPNHSI